MGWFTDMVTDMTDRAKELFAKPVEPALTNAVQSSWFDRYDYDKLLAKVPAVKGAIEALGQDLDYMEDFGKDLFNAFYKVDPQLTPLTELASSRQPNRAVIKTLLELPEVADLRQYTTSDQYCTAMAMLGMQETVREALTKAAEERAESEKRQAEAEQAAQEAQEQAQALMDQLAAQQAQEAEQEPQEGQEQDGEEQEGGSQEQGDLADRLKAALDQAEQAQAQAVQAAADANDASQHAAMAMGKAMRAAAGQTDQKLGEEVALARAFGTEDGVLQKMDVKQRMALAEKLRGNRLAKFVKLLGQFKTVQQAESRRRVVNAASEIHGITESNEITRMVAGEYLNFADESLQTLMLSRWASSTLVTSDVRGKEKLGQGPIICVVDESGSMDTDDVAGGTREAWSKALCLAMLDQARQRSRDFIYIGFSSVNQQRVVKFPGGVASLDKVIQMTEGFFDGGTYYEKPLQMALDLIETDFDAHGKPRPDIVFMTDDEYGAMNPAFMEKWFRVKDKASITCYGLAIGCGFSGALAQISDNVRSITTLVSDPKNVGDLFRNI